jgi:tRNA-2-methylthio-N6-dimethylallyladenosine synthase
MKYYIITYGCQMNRSDSERTANRLEAKGVFASDKPENADIVIVNMCSIRQASVDRVFGLSDRLKALKSKNPRLITVLTGCVLKDDKIKFNRIFDHAVNIDSLNDWLDIMIGLTHPETAEPSNPGRKTKFSVGIPISAGCDNFCSYCVVPYTRGTLVSRDWRDIISETKTAVANGAREIWLLGQNVNNYRFKANERDAGIDFAQLIEKVNALPGEFWIRFTSPHPKDFNDTAVNAVASCLKVTPYFNLPVQSGDDSVLKAMARPYTAAQYLRLVDRIRAAFRQYRSGIESIVALSTDVIVGFPGETKDNFSNTADLFKKVGFDMAYIARYSPRSGTAAAKLPDSVPMADKERRFRALTDILFATSAANNEKYIGLTLPVLIDRVFDKKGLWATGKTRSYKTVKFRLKTAGYCQAGDIVNIRIIKALPLGLGGEPA